MKNLFLFLGAIIILLASCKKQNPEPAFIGDAIPSIKPYYVKYNGIFKYTQDSMNVVPGYTTTLNSWSYCEMSIIDSVNNTEKVQMYYYINFANNTVHMHFQNTEDSRNLTHWVKLKFQLRKTSPYTGTASRYYTVYKKYTFREGNLGTINFNTLP